MTREEALNRFVETFADPQHIKALLALDAEVESNYDAIQQGIVDSFRQLFKLAIAAEKEVSVITVSILRSSLKTGGSHCLISAYGQKWFLDVTPIEIYYDAKWTWEHTHNYENLLNAERRKYVGKITKEDTENIKWGKVEDYMVFLLTMFRKAMDSVVNLEEYQQLKKAPHFDIRLGEYHDSTLSIWRENNASISQDEVRAIIEGKSERHTTHCHYKDLDLSKGVYNETNFAFARFERINFAECSMFDSELLGTRFLSCDMAGANLYGCALWAGDFTGSNLKGANLAYTNYGYEVDAKRANRKTFTRINFSGADLREADLSHGNFMGADFRGAKLEGCNLTGTNLTHALIDMKYRDSLPLTAEQRGEIVWMS